MGHIAALNTSTHTDRVIDNVPIDHANFRRFVMPFNTFVKSRLLEALDPTIIDSFEKLTGDHVKYIKSDFQSRFRHFSSFVFRDDEISLDTTYSSIFSGPRRFQTSFNSQHVVPALSGNIIPAMIKCLRLIMNVSPVKFDAPVAIGVHQIRVIADKANVGDNAPGLHQDGYDYSCDLNFRRDNVLGAETILSTSSSETDLFFEEPLFPGEFVFFDDRNLHHTARKVKVVDDKKPAIRDMAIIDFVVL